MPATCLVNSITCGFTEKRGAWPSCFSNTKYYQVHSRRSSFIRPDVLNLVLDAGTNIVPEVTSGATPPAACISGRIRAKPSLLYRVWADRILTNKNLHRTIFSDNPNWDTCESTETPVRVVLHFAIYAVAWVQMLGTHSVLSLVRLTFICVMSSFYKGLCLTVLVFQRSSSLS